MSYTLTCGANGLSVCDAVLDVHVVYVILKLVKCIGIGGNAGLNEVCGVEYALVSAVKVLHDVNAALGLFAVDALLVLMAKDSAARVCRVKHSAHVVEYLSSVRSDVARVGYEEGEYSDPRGSENVCKLAYVLGKLDVCVDIVGELYLSERRSDRPYSESVSIKLLLDLLSLVNGKGGDVLSVNASYFGVLNAVFEHTLDLL